MVRVEPCLRPVWCSAVYSVSVDRVVLPARSPTLRQNRQGHCLRGQTARETAYRGGGAVSDACMRVLEARAAGDEGYRAPEGRDVPGLLRLAPVITYPPLALDHV